MILGLNVVSHRLALTVRNEWAVVPHPTRKRRRGWHVVWRRVEEPGAYRLGNTIYLHPDLVEKMKQGTSSVWPPLHAL